MWSTPDVCCGRRSEREMLEHRPHSPDFVVRSTLHVLAFPAFSYAPVQRLGVPISQEIFLHIWVSSAKRKNEVSVPSWFFSTSTPTDVGVLSNSSKKKKLPSETLSPLGQFQPCSKCYKGKRACYGLHPPTQASQHLHKLPSNRPEKTVSPGKG